MSSEDKIRKLIREEVRNILHEQDGEWDFDTPWRRVMDIVADASIEYSDVEDIGKKIVDGEEVHEFAINNIIFQIKRLKE